MPQTQEEFYFSLPYDRMDLCLYAFNHQVPAAEVAPALGLTRSQVERVFQDIQAKRRVAHYLHLPPNWSSPSSDPPEILVTGPQRPNPDPKTGFLVGTVPFSFALPGGEDPLVGL